jgi:hypothetical protein
MNEDGSGTAAADPWPGFEINQKCLNVGIVYYAVLINVAQ